MCVTGYVSMFFPKTPLDPSLRLACVGRSGQGGEHDIGRLGGTWISILATMSSFGFSGSPLDLSSLFRIPKTPKSKSLLRKLSSFAARAPRGSPFRRRLCGGFQLPLFRRLFHTAPGSGARVVVI